MAGILANSVSKTMVGGDTSADNSVSGYVTGEQITFSVTPTGSSYQWGLAKPSGATARSDLNDDTLASPVLTPDVGGYYVVTCVVDSTTTYVLRLAAAALVSSTLAGALRLVPVLDAAVPSPPTGHTLFDSTRGMLMQKSPSGAMIPMLAGTVGAALTDADATLDVTGGVHYAAAAGVLTAERTLTLAPTFAGFVIWVYRLEAVGFEGVLLNVVNGGPGAGTLVAEDESFIAKFKSDGTNWAIDEFYQL